MRNILFLLLFFISSCNKDNETTTIEGKVINTGSKQPIDSVMVQLQDGVGSSGGMFSLGTSNTSGSGKIQTIYTNKDGYFKISMICEAPFGLGSLPKSNVLFRAVPDK